MYIDGKYLSVAVLGYLFDYRNTEYTNEDIVKRLSESVDVEEFDAATGSILRSFYCTL